MRDEQGRAVWPTDGHDGGNEFFQEGIGAVALLVVTETLHLLGREDTWLARLHVSRHTLDWVHHGFEAFVVAWFGPPGEATCAGEWLTRPGGPQQMCAKIITVHFVQLA